MTHCHALIKSLRQQGHRITPQREMIIQAVAHSERHLSAEEIFAQVQRQTSALNLATVYRTLDLLVSSGLISRLDLGEGRVVYANWRHGSHIHLVCRCCTRTFEVDQHLLAPLKQQLQACHNFEADLQHISISGLCSDCQDRTTCQQEV